MRILVLLLLLLSGTAQGQIQQLDSLQAALFKAETDSARIEISFELNKYYSLSDPEKARHFALSADKLAGRSNNLRSKVKALNLIGYSFLVSGEYDRGLATHLKALKIAEQLRDTAGIISSYHGLGIMYNKVDDLKRAIYYFNNEISLAKLTNDTFALGKAYNGLGNTYEAEKDYKKALFYFQGASAFQEQINDKRSLAVSLLNTGGVFLHLNQPRKALPVLFKSLQVDKAIHNEMNPLATLKVISRAYLALGNKDEALKYAQQAYNRATKNGASKKVAAAAKLMHEIYAARKEYDLAYTYLNIFIDHQTILDQNTQKKIAAELTAKYETEKKEFENQELKADKIRQEAEIKNKNIVLVAAVLVMMVLLILIIEVYRSKRNVNDAYLKLHEASQQLQKQHTEINIQKNELTAQAQVLKRQNEELEKHDQFKSKIFSIISHDLRAPFNSIKGILNISQQTTFSPAEVQHIFNLLSRDVEVSLNMINNLLVWSKAQLSESKVILRHINLHQLVQENIDLAGSLARQKQLNLVNNIADNLVVFIDRERINFVLRNLLSNAIKFSYDNGSITFRAKTYGDTLEITIEDGGKGITAGNMRKLFTEQRFTTIGTAHERGTGLGLMLCKELIESLHGQIMVTSEEGKGSIFTVILPNAAIPVIPQEIKSLTA